MKHTLIITAGLCVASLALPCHAQSSNYENAILGQSMEARVGITIPFGGDGKSKKSKPQLTLIGRRTQSNRSSIDWAMKPSFGKNDYVETRLALTLSGDPELRFNDQAIYHFDTEQADLSDGVKTAGKVALGAGLVVLTVVVVGVVVILTADHTDE